MTHISIPYGTGYQEADLDETKVAVEVLDPSVKRMEKTPEELIEAALDYPIGTKRLEEMVVPEDKITIMVDDQTRPGPHTSMCRALIRRLNEAGVPDQNITFVIATGSHGAPTQEQLHKILGGLEERIRVHVHDCQDGTHVYMGNTPTMDVPIYLDRFVAESDFIVTTGLIAPHHVAGFSGGRKSIVPGVVSLDTLRKHHSLPIRPYEPAINYFEDNPFHKIALEAAKMVKVRFILNVVQDIHKQITKAVAGDLEQAHLKGVAFCRQANTVDVHGLADVVISSPGGAPRDIDLWQSQKALSVAELLCTGKDCTFILCARAEKGIPQLFVDWMTHASCPQEVVERFRKEGFGIGSNKAFMYARALIKGRIILVSEGLTEEQAHSVMMDWAPDLQTAVNMVMESGTPKKIMVVPRAVNIIPNILPEN